MVIIQCAETMACNEDDDELFPIVERRILSNINIILLMQSVLIRHVMPFLILWMMELIQESLLSTPCIHGLITLWIYHLRIKNYYFKMYMIL